MPHHVGQRRLRDPQQRHLVGRGQGARGAAQGEPDPGARRPRAEPFQRGRQRSVLQVRRREGPYEPTRLGEVLLGRLPGPADVRQGRRVRGQAALGGAQQQLDGGQALRQGVVDLPGEPLPLREDPGTPLGGGQLGPGGDELLDQLAPPLALPVQRLVAQYGRHRHGPAQQRPEEGPRGHRAAVREEASDRGAGRHRDGRHPPAQPQQVQLQEVQREGDPQPVGGDRQQRRPGRAQPGQPHRPGARRAVHHGGQYARQVHGGQHRAGGDHPALLRRRVGDGPPGGQREQAEEQRVQAQPQDAGDGVRARPPGAGAGRAVMTRPA